MVRGKSQGSLPKVEGSLCFTLPGISQHWVWWCMESPGWIPGECGTHVLGTRHGAAKPSGAAMGFSWVSSTGVRGLCLWGVQKPWGHLWASGLEFHAALQAGAPSRHRNMDHSGLLYFPASPAGLSQGLICLQTKDVQEQVAISRVISLTLTSISKHISNAIGTSRLPILGTFCFGGRAGAQRWLSLPSWQLQESCNLQGMSEMYSTWKISSKHSFPEHWDKPLSSFRLGRIFASYKRKDPVWGSSDIHLTCPETVTPATGRGTDSAVRTGSQWSQWELMFTSVVLPHMDTDKCYEF